MNANVSAAQLEHQPLEVFISYSHKDEALKDELCIHLAKLTHQSKIKPWQDRQIEAGNEWDDEIKIRLESADIILLLITPRFIASKYCYSKEMKRAMERHEEGRTRVIPIIMKPCDWEGLPFSKLQGLPKDGKPVNTWNNQDEALSDVAKGIRNVVTTLGTRKVLDTKGENTDNHNVSNQLSNSHNKGNVTIPTMQNVFYQHGWKVNKINQAQGNINIEEHHYINESKEND